MEKTFMEEFVSDRIVLDAFYLNGLLPHEFDGGARCLFDPAR
jgi:hypothetical protein